MEKDELIEYAKQLGIAGVDGRNSEDTIRNKILEFIKEE